jgi:hypothetical protein
VASSSDPQPVLRPEVGSQLLRDGRFYVVTQVMPRMTRYTKKNQDTRIEGYTLGLRLALPTDSPLVDYR